jgi:4-hydroxybenzoate polyprenyltransferase
VAFQSEPVSDGLHPRPRPRRGPIRALIAGLRPKQWTKNLLLFAALLFTLDQKHSARDFVLTLEAFAIFCVLSGANYLVNDIQDVAADRHHPTKSHRPIAAGELKVGTAAIWATVLIAASLAAAFHLGTGFGIAAAAYCALTLAYSFHIKHVVLLDLLFLASGFVLRAVAGAWVIHVRISPWLILCTMLLALFLGIAKRRGELIAVLGGRKVGRGVIGEYSAELLDQMSTIVTSALLMSYALYTIQSAAATKHHYLMATIPFVLYGIFRYLYLVHKKNQGESPDEVIYKDKPLLACLGLWGLATALIITHQ